MQSIAPLTTIYIISLLAFSKRSRFKVGKRDDWECQGDCCLGKDGNPASFKDGWMVQAAHHDHTRNAGYDDPENGRILCIAHHALEHLQKGELREAQSILAMGIYTWDADEKGIDDEQIKLHHSELEAYIESVMAQYLAMVK